MCICICLSTVGACTGWTSKCFTRLIKQKTSVIINILWEGLVMILFGESGWMDIPAKQALHMNRLAKRCLIELRTVLVWHIINDSPNIPALWYNIVFVYTCVANYLTTLI